MQSYGHMIAIQAETTHVTSSGSSDIPQRHGQQPDGAGPTGAANRLSYPAAVAVWIGAGLLGWGLIAGLVVALN